MAKTPKRKLKPPFEMTEPKRQVLRGIAKGTDLAAAFPITVDEFWRQGLLRRGEYGSLLLTDKGKKVLNETAR